ncbi:quinol:cytochrome C oxidoreductase [Bacteroidota bacterium]
MKDQVNLSVSLKIVTGICIVVGLVAFIFGFIQDPGRTWASYLLNNYYFLMLALGAAFFVALQHIAQAGWSAAFKRVGEAMSGYIPVSAIFFLILAFGVHSLYEWSHPEMVAQDELIAHKAPYLNLPFFLIRLILFFSLWILMVRLTRKASLMEDLEGGLNWFHKSEHLSKIFIFIMALTISLSAVDWVMSIDVHWFSALFALKNFIASFYHGTAILILIVLILNRKGYFEFLNSYHLHDFSRYIFMLAIIWGYFWFAQFMLIWYGNIPEETVYYVVRWESGWKTLFFAEILFNWFVPFIILLPTRTSRSKAVIFAMVIILIVGHYIDLYMQIIPGTTGILQFGFIELGSFLGYAGLFTLVTGWYLSRAPLIPENHPYLSESLEHHF